MQINISNLSSLVGDFRLDAECYKQSYIENEEMLISKPHTRIGQEVETFSKGAFDINAESYVQSGVPFIRIADLKGMVVEERGLVYINQKDNDRYPNSILNKGDVVLSKTAKPAASLITVDVANTSQDTIAIKLKTNSKISGVFLTTFLNSRYGYLQMLRWFTGNIQMHLNLKDSKNIIIPIFSNSFLKRIERIFQQGMELNRSSKVEYSNAKDILLSELGLTNWRPKHQLTFIKKYSDTEQAERIDAEYYQPKYEAIIKAIKAYKGGWETLGDLVNLKDSNFIPIGKNTYQYIELANIAGNGEITDCITEKGQNLPTRARRKVNTGDLIVSSIEGSLSSIAIIEEEYNDALCSTGFYVINSNHLNSGTLLVLLKSFIGQLQLKKGCSGTILTAINPNEFSRIILPILPEPKQLQIQQKITKSFELRKQSKQLLENAKCAVEIAIEQDEQTAIEWLAKNNSTS